MATTQNKTSFLIDIRQTKEYASFMQKIGWRVEKIDGIYLFIKKLPLLPFSVAKILRCQQVPPIQKLIKLKKKYRILFIKIQSMDCHPGAMHQTMHGDRIPNKVDSIASGRTIWYIPSLQNDTYSEDKHPLIPTKTIWLDLLKPENQLLAEIKAKTRYNIKLAQKKGLKVKIIPGDQITNNLLTGFYFLWSKNKPFNWLFKPSFNELKYLVKSFGNKCFFVFAHHVIPAPARGWSALGGKAGIYTNNYLNRFLVKPGMTKEILISSCLILTSNNMAFYWHNCSSKEGKKLFAPTLCVWQAILESKKRKLQIFDLEGIWDQRYPKLNQGWQGFSRFKQGFGGGEIKFSQPLFIRGW